MNNLETATKVLSGYRLEKPTSCPEDVYFLMRSCWEEAPENRPSFEKIIEQIDSMIQKREGNSNTSSNQEQQNNYQNPTFHELSSTQPTLWSPKIARPGHTNGSNALPIHDLWTWEPRKFLSALPRTCPSHTGSTQSIRRRFGRQKRGSLEHLQLYLGE